MSTGDRSTGDYSTGYRSTSNYSTGYFSTIDYMGLSCFNKPITIAERENQYIPSWCYFTPAEWVETKNMTEKKRKS